MAVVTRVRSKPAAKTAAAPVSRIIRRVRLAPKAVVTAPKPVTIEPDDLRAMDSILKSISKIDLEVRQRQVAREESVKKLRKLMKTYKLSVHEAHGMIASVFRPAGRSTSTVDPYDYQKLVTDEEFMSTVKVQITEAKKVLPEKELLKITQTTPAKLGEETIEVKAKG